MAIDLLSFEEAQRKTGGSRRHLLLGNGFSIALFPDRFRYGSLLQQAKDDGLFNDFPEIFEAFEILDTTDFEVVLEALVRMTKLIHLYVDEADPKRKMLADVERLKEALVTAVAGTHPARLGEISEEQFQNCRNFLLQFAGKGLDKPACIYTLNYDLLLYWTVQHEPAAEWDGDRVVEPDPATLIKHDDGFRSPDDFPDAPFVTWDIDGGSNTQNIHFLHGGLHLFDAGFELQKFCWERAGGIPLMDQIREALDNEKYPMFVSEGNSDSKLDKILHSGYLTRSYKSLAGVCQSPGNTLFIYGHSLAESDDHILKLIEDGRFRSLFVSLYGDPHEEWNQAIIEKAERLAANRGGFKLDVFFYDAASAKVWG
ncbi:MAG: DUF4917 family protein [Sphingomonas sp.]